MEDTNIEELRATSYTPPTKTTTNQTNNNDQQQTKPTHLEEIQSEQPKIRV